MYVMESITSKCYLDIQMLSLQFCSEEGKRLKEMEKVVCIVKKISLEIRTTANDLLLVQLLGFWSSCSWSTVAMSKGEAIADPLPSLLCNVTKSSKEAAAEPMMGAINNSNKIWYF